jgi:hypothetical protein
LHIEPTEAPVVSQLCRLGNFSDDEDDSSDDDEGAELLESSNPLEEDDSGSTEGVELLESSDSSGTLVISEFSSLQAVSDNIENAAIAAIAQT